MAISLALLSRLAAAVPASWDDGLAGWSALAARLLAPHRHQGACANQAALFPDADAERLARAAHHAYARFLIEYLREMGRGLPDDPARNAFSVGPGVLDALAGGRGLVMCTAHVGNWEMGARALARLGRPIQVIAEPQYARAWRPAVLASKRGAGLEIVAPDASPRGLVRALERGGVVGLLVDGAGYTLGRATSLGGRAAMMPTGPARLAALSGAVLAGGTCFRVAPDRFATELHALGGSEHTPVRDADVLHDAVARWLLETLLAHPGAWCIFRPFFAPGPQALRHAA